MPGWLLTACQMLPRAACLGVFQVHDQNECQSCTLDVASSPRAADGQQKGEADFHTLGVRRNSCCGSAAGPHCQPARVQLPLQDCSACAVAVGLSCAELRGAPEGPQWAFLCMLAYRPDCGQGSIIVAAQSCSVVEASLLRAMSVGKVLLPHSLALHVA